jgi:hypothetical protein
MSTRTETAFGILLCGITLVVLLNYLANVFLPTFRPSDSDFSELYASSWLWRHGQNPYNPALATPARQRITGGSAEIFLVHVPTTLVLVSPLTFLRWGWAHLLFLVVATAGLGITIFSMLQLQRRTWGLATGALILFLIAFSPVRTAFQWGNIVLLAWPFAMCTIMFAEYRVDSQAGLFLGLTICLKPQIGIWLALYYLLRRRLRMLLSALAIGLFVIGLFFLHPIPSQQLFSFYLSNLHHWFAPGGSYGFTEGSAVPYVLRSQGIFFRISHHFLLSTFLSHTLFLIGLAAWAILVRRCGERIPPCLAVGALWALSFLSFYHSIPDLSILTILLCDAFPECGRSWSKMQKLVCAVLLIMMVPQRLIFVFLSRAMNPSVVRSWWWDLFIERYLVWLLLLLGFFSLLLMRERYEGMLAHDSAIQK